MNKLDAVLLREVLFGTRLRVSDLFIVKEGHNGFDLVAALHFLKSGCRGNPAAEQNALFHHGKLPPETNVFFLGRLIADNNKREKGTKEKKRKIPPSSHDWLQMFIMKSNLSKLTFSKWVHCVSR
jgi:hypothetical protein